MYTHAERGTLYAFTHMLGHPICMYTRLIHVWRNSFIRDTTYLYLSHMNESCLTYEWVMSHIWMRHDSFICDTTYLYLSFIWDTFIALTFIALYNTKVARVCSTSDVTHPCVTWLIHICDMTRSHVWHDSFVCVPGLIHMLERIHSCVRHDSFIRAHVWHVSFTYVTWLLHMLEMTHSYVWHDSFICVTWLIPMRDMTHSYAW